ncbi:MAG: GNAT family N-acetyltransferase [Marinovum sp.]|nr:GNAT family N-acetyltransferase [Marinovum sp.]
MSFHSASLLRSQFAPLSQSYALGAALTHIGQPPLRFSMSKGRGEVQIIRRRMGPFRVGLISRADVPRDDIRRLAHEAQCGAFLLNPETQAGQAGIPLRTPSSVVELNVADPVKDLKAGLKQKWRNRLNYAQSQGLKISETGLNTHDGHWLLDMEVAQSRLKKYANWPTALTMAYARANKAQVRIFEARQTGGVIAAMLFLCHESVATYHIGWSGEEGRALSAHHAVFWRAVERLKERGTKRVDLGQVATDRAPGLARFKLGTGGTLKQLGGSWLVLPH